VWCGEVGRSKGRLGYATVTYGRESISLIVSPDVNGDLLVPVITLVEVKGPVSRGGCTSDMGAYPSTCVQALVVFYNRSAHLIQSDLLERVYHRTGGFL